MITKKELIDLGNKHHFLNYIDHETPRNYFPYDLDSYIDTTDIHELKTSICDLHLLLTKIYEKVDIV